MTALLCNRDTCPTDSSSTELGHFTGCKSSGSASGIGVGYPRALICWANSGILKYTLNWIPFGGFVRLIRRGSRIAAAWQLCRSTPLCAGALILVAGVTANIILAWALLTGAYILGVPSVIDSVNPGENAHLFITDVVPGSPASAAGLAAGDEIVSIKSAKSDSPDAFYPEMS